MTARVLIVDDIPSNLKLLEARLMAEYFQVLSATNGASAISICEAGECDIVILDVMMPELDGFEVCHRLKNNPDTMHIPVIMVTALDSIQDRVRGLEAGADDFLTKPVNDLALVTRVKSLARLKMLTDDLRMRTDSNAQLPINNDVYKPFNVAVLQNAEFVIVDDSPKAYSQLQDIMGNPDVFSFIPETEDALIRIAEGGADLAIISIDAKSNSGLRLCAHLRSLERTRNLPIIVVSQGGQDHLVSQAFELGVNDYVHFPVDAQELRARIVTQMRRKHYNDCLRETVQRTIELAVRDPLTRLYNRRYFDGQFASMIDKAKKSGKPLTVAMIDIDHFKRVNDSYGHDAGDTVIRECARRLQNSVRSIDLVCRFGGEEFVIIMPETGIERAMHVAERIRAGINADSIHLIENQIDIPVTVSLGVSALVENDTLKKLLKRADVALYDAKRRGRNLAISVAA